MDREDQILVSLGRIEAKVDTALISLATHIVDDKEVEKRVRKVEGRQSWFLGVAACGSIVIPTVITIAVKTMF